MRLVVLGFVVVWAGLLAQWWFDPPQDASVVHVYDTPPPTAQQRERQAKRELYRRVIEQLAQEMNR